jgi:putative ABC transport system permease protein
MIYLPFVIRRAIRNWKVLLTLILGVVLATALLATGPLLVDAVIQFSLRSSIENSNPLSGNIFMKTTSSNYQEEDIRKIDDSMNSLLSETLGLLLDDSYLSLDSRFLFPWEDDFILKKHRINFVYFEDIGNRIEFIDGSWSSDGLLETGVVQGVIGAKMASEYKLVVGDHLPLSLSDKDFEPNLWLEITGIVRSKNPLEVYWFGVENPLEVLSSNRWEAEYSVILQQDRFFDVSEDIFKNPLTTMSWRVLLQKDTIQRLNIHNVTTRIEALNHDVKVFSPTTRMVTDLTEVLGNYASQSNAIRAPLYLLTSEIVLLALFYVIMVATLSMQQIEREFSILISRGASQWQILQIQIVESVLIGFLALISGPGVGVQLIRWLTLYGPLADVVRPGWELDIPQAAWTAAIIGAFASILSQLFPLIPALKRSIVTHQQQVARVSSKPLWQRLYLDVFVLVIGLTFFIRLRLYGGIVAGTISNPRVDWLLLLSPLALLMGTATILLRIFPLILNAFEKITARGRGLSGVLAMWQSSRNPNNLAHIVLLLTLAMSLGVLSIGLKSTMDQSEFERSNYAAGSDIRLVSENFISSDDYIDEPGVNHQTSVWRGRGSITTRPYTQFDVLAIEPYGLTETSYFRSDFSTRSMGQLLGYMVVDDYLPQPSIELPGQPRSLGIWIWALQDSEVPSRSARYMGTSDLDRIEVGAKIQTAQGEFKLVELHPAGEGIEDFRNLDFLPYPEGGWRFFSSPLLNYIESDFPINLLAILFKNRTRFLSGETTNYARLNIVIDDVTVMDELTGTSMIATSFEHPMDIWYFEGGTSNITFDRFHEPHSGDASLNLVLDFISGNHIGMRLASGRKTEALPALVSQSFLDSTNAKLGDDVVVSFPRKRITFNIMDVIEYFPTLYDDEKGGFLITQRTPLLALLNESPLAEENINEVWLRTDGSVSGVSLAEKKPEIIEIFEVATLSRAFKADPMGLGLRSVTYFGYLLTTILSLIGYISFFYLNARRRETDYGILRAIGLAPSQLFSSLVLEQVVLIFAGLSLGIGLGMLLNQITLPNLPITLADQPPIPPFIPHSNWIAVRGICVDLAIYYMISLAVATFLLWRSQIHRVLRIGEE